MNPASDTPPSVMYRKPSMTSPVWPDRSAVRSTQPLEKPSMLLASTLEFDRFVGTVSHVSPPSVEMIRLA